MGAHIPQFKKLHSMNFIWRLVRAFVVSVNLLSSANVFGAPVNLLPARTGFFNGLSLQRGFEEYAKAETVFEDPVKNGAVGGEKIAKLTVVAVPRGGAKDNRNFVLTSVKGSCYVFNERRSRLSFEVFTKDTLSVVLSLGYGYGIEGNKMIPWPGAKELQCISGPTGGKWTEVSFILGPANSQCDAALPEGVMRFQPNLAVSGQGTVYFRNLAIIEVDGNNKPVDYAFDAPAPTSAPMIPDIPKGKRSDWIDVKKDITKAAVGNGIADDTEALQSAFKAMKNGTTLHIPSGTYRITKTLDLGGAYNAGGIFQGCIVGNGRSTKIVWDGEDGGVMIKSLGYSHSSYTGFVLDGNGKAATGVLHAARIYETDMLYQHVACLNFTGEAISIGKEHEGNLETAEVLYDNCLFERCKTGIAFTRNNDYDNTIQGCEFRNCGTGILNRSGNAYVRDCHFERNSSCDIDSLGEHSSSVRRCTSYGSMMFLKNNDPISGMVVQDCQIADWKNPAGAMEFANGLLFDCRFYKDTKNPPLVINGNGGRLLVSDNRTESGAPVFVSPDISGFSCIVYEIPEGELKGSLVSAKQSFLKTSIPMVGKIFDAKRDFGAKGDGKADDTDAVQNTINAARETGNDAEAYFPTGNYFVGRTIEMSGANYRLGGSGEGTRIEWKGPEGGTILHVADPDHLTVQNICIGSIPSTKNGNDILQTSTGKKTSHICYDRLFVVSPVYSEKAWGSVDQSDKRGLRLEGLKKNDTVLVKYMRGNLHCVDSADATILCNASYNTGHIVVEGKSKERSGFTGIMSKLGVCENPTITIKDGNSITVSDLYMESDARFLLLKGALDDPAGRVTIQGAKLDREDKADNLPGILIDGYKGELSIGPDQFYVSEPLKRIIHKGDGPFSLLLLGNFFYNCRPEFALGRGARLHMIGNKGRAGEKMDLATALSDTDLNAALPQISRSLDDLRRLGEIDLRLNHAEVLK